MATVTGFTAERMLAMEAATIVGGTVNGGGHLILTKHDASTVDAGSVIGPTGAPGVSQVQLDTFMNDHLPVGSSVEYIGLTSPSVKWLLATGQTVVNGQTLYPAFWAIIPAGMKSGSSIIMPDMRGKVIVAYDATQTEFDAILETGGAKTHVLTPAETAVKGRSITDPGHHHSTAISGVMHRTPELGLGPSAGDGTFPPYNDGEAIDTTINTTGITLADGANGSAHNNLQPYIIMQRLIKVA